MKTRKRALFAFVLGAVSSCASGDKAGLWRSDVPVIPLAAAGWTGGASGANRVFAYQEINFFGGTNRLFELDLGTNHWIERAPNPVFYGTAGSGMVDGVLFECGPDTMNTALTCASYDAVSDAWTTLAPDPNGVLLAPAVVGLDHLLYVVGPLSTGLANAVIHSFDPATQSWSFAGIFNGNGTAPVVVAHDEKLYMIGTSGPSPQTTQVLDPHGAANPVEIGPIPVELVSIHSAVSLGNRIYVLGDTGSDRSSLWSWEPAADRWTRIDSLPQKHVQASLVTDGEHLFALGGFTNTSETAASNAADLYYLP